MTIIAKTLKDTAFSILDKSKSRGFHFLNDLRFYASQFNLPTETIFDVGANIGQTSIELRKYFPNSSIHAFEPINSTFEILNTNCRNSQGIVLNNVALGAENKELEIIVGMESCMNSLLNEVTSKHQEEQIQVVRVIKGDEYSKNNNITSVFLLKTDTEGYDLDVLSGFETMIAQGQILFIFSEVTFDEENISQTSFFKINKYLNSHGYTFSGLYDLVHHGGFMPNLKYCNCLWALVPNKK